jgi:hypothetical protein
MIRALYKLIQKESFSSQLKWMGFTLASCSTSVLFSKHSNKTEVISSRSNEKFKHSKARLQAYISTLTNYIFPTRTISEVRKESNAGSGAF